MLHIVNHDITILYFMMHREEIQLNIQVNSRRNNQDKRNL